MFYQISNLKPCDTLPEKDYVAIIPAENACSSPILKKFLSKIPTLLMNFHFSKVEFFADFVFVSIHIPEIFNGKTAQLSILFDMHNIIFIDQNGFSSVCFEKVIELHSKALSSAGTLLYYLLDYVISGDLEKMNALQQNLAALEQSILSEHISEPLKKITDCRNNTMHLYHYYIQLSEICGELYNKTQNFFTEEEQKQFQILSNQVTLLCHEAQQIWEYTSQIRDVYQQQLESHQNSIMKFLTMVTTIFMPLTLITGWYGMNFAYMPELTLNYSYPLVFALSILLVIILCIIFKRKKWW
jgi:magnesium transporter